ncbi:hypothetical protein LTR85_011402 [Meristemomyces frigidus]|nr:hypothetical protein LTR85_011402 [Meristemomyces frigidus]
MRLINLSTLEFEEYYDDQIPPYAILSHRWSKSEVSYKDFLKARFIDGPGYDKILGFVALARERKARIWNVERCEVVEVPIEYGWVDTCCIDKKSSAELSEAINSMFAWYHKAAVNMPLLYGEGGKAFLRLQENIIQRSNDQSIFAWYNPKGDRGMLASHPNAFAMSSNILLPELAPFASHSLTNNVLEMRAKAYEAYDKRLKVMVCLVKLTCGTYESLDDARPDKREFVPTEIALVNANASSRTWFRRLLYRGHKAAVVDYPEDARRDLGEVLFHVQAWDPVQDFAA